MLVAIGDDVQQWPSLQDTTMPWASGRKAEPSISSGPRLCLQPDVASVGRQDAEVETQGGQLPPVVAAGGSAAYAYLFYVTFSSARHSLLLGDGAVAPPSFGEDDRTDQDGRRRPARSQV